MTIYQSKFTYDSCKAKQKIKLNEKYGLCSCFHIVTSIKATAAR